jgi:ketosteroid isomerase-like protein
VSNLDDEFSAVYEAWAAAMRARDAGWFADLEHPQFLYVGPDGIAKDKAAHIEQATRGVRGELRTDIERVRTFDNLAIVTGTHWVRSDVPVEAGLSRQVVEQMQRGVLIRFSSVWLEEPGGRRLIHHHTTRVER